MKQGRGNSRTSATPVNRPVARAVPPAYPAGLGNMKGNHVTDRGAPVPNPPVPMHEGRGARAPMTGRTTHKSGSQGKH